MALDSDFVDEDEIFLNFLEKFFLRKFLNFVRFRHKNQISVFYCQICNLLVDIKHQKKIPKEFFSKFLKSNFLLDFYQIYRFQAKSKDK